MPPRWCNALFTTPVALSDLVALYGSLPRSMLDLTVGLTALFMLMDPVYDAWAKRERPVPAGLLGAMLFALLLVGIQLFGWFGSTSFIYFQF
jgi:hypothetical protein